MRENFTHPTIPLKNMGIHALDSLAFLAVSAVSGVGTGFAKSNSEIRLTVVVIQLKSAACTRTKKKQQHQRSKHQDL